MPYYIYVKHCLSIIVLLFMGLSCIKAQRVETNQRDSFEILKKKAQESEAFEDWKKVIHNAESRKDTADIGYAYILYAQAFANKCPTGDLDKELRPILSFLYETRQYDYYFASYNLLISRLFSNQAYRKAEQEAARMYSQAKQLDLPICVAMALRVQGQIFYKLNLYEKAYATLQESLETCPPYQENLNAFSTAQSVCEWLMMTCIKREAYNEILPLADLYGEMLDYWNGQGWKDPSGHYPVTHLSFRAIGLLKTGRTGEASDCLNKALSYMRPDCPARAYEHFYEARYMLRYDEGKYKEAIADIDTLLNTHQYYFSFYLQDLLSKAELLSLSGQSQQSIGLYRTYIHANDSIAKEEIARQLNELQVQYQVEKTQQENLRKTRYLQFAFIIIALITLLLSLYIIYAHTLNAKNHLLVTRLEERDKWAQYFLPLEQNDQEQPADSTSAKSVSLEIIQRLNTFMINEQPYRNPALDRKELAKALQLNERALANALREVNNQTVLEYITMYRLENARHLISLRNTDTLKEIAERSGFGTLRTFQRYFRERYGMPPSRYREIIAGKE